MRTKLLRSYATAHQRISTSESKRLEIAKQRDELDRLISVFISCVRMYVCGACEFVCVWLFICACRHAKRLDITQLSDWYSIRSAGLTMSTRSRHALAHVRTPTRTHKPSFHVCAHNAMLYKHTSTTATTAAATSKQATAMTADIFFVLYCVYTDYRVRQYFEHLPASERDGLSLYYLLQSTYPEFDWLPWKFSTVPESKKIYGAAYNRNNNNNCNNINIYNKCAT